MELLVTRCTGAVQPVPTSIFKLGSNSVKAKLGGVEAITKSDYVSPNRPSVYVKSPVL